MAFLFAVGILSGCTTYHPLDLPTQVTLLAQVNSLTNASETASNTYVVDPADGLDLTEVAIFAVLNNPDLKAKRAERDVVAAQVFAAGLLPDPQLAASLDNPTGAAAGLVTGWGVGFDYDLLAIITRQRRLEAERQGAVQVNLEVLWEEWQVIQRARILCIRYLTEERQQNLLGSMRKLYEERYTRSTHALAQKNMTMDVSGTDLTALLDVQTQIIQIQQAHNDTRHALNYLLGLTPDVKLHLKDLPSIVFPDAQVVAEQLATLAQRRPDLLALQAGYHAQEAHLRAAILAQFPALSVGVNRARGTDSVHTTGLGVSLNLPLFSGNRSAIAIERATRAQLREAYQARLAQAVTDVDRLVRLHHILGLQIENLRHYLPELTELVQHTRKAYAQGDIEALSFLNIESTWLNKQLEQLQTEQVQMETTVALETLLALPVDASEPALVQTLNH